MLVPLAALALVALGGSVYTLSHAGPTTAHAQQAVGQQAPDKETQDDNTVKAATNASVDKPEANDTADKPEINDQPNTPGANVDHQANGTE